MKELRQAKGITAKVLAERIGVAHITIYRFESGDVKPSQERRRQIAEALGRAQRDVWG